MITKSLSCIAVVTNGQGQLDTCVSQINAIIEAEKCRQQRFISNSKPALHTDAHASAQKSAHDITSQADELPKTASQL